jgi:hypothetical protein
MLQEAKMFETWRGQGNERGLLCAKQPLWPDHSPLPAKSVKNKSISPQQDFKKTPHKRNNTKNGVFIEPFLV